GLAGLDHPRLLQHAGDEVRAVDVVGDPALHRDVVGVLELAGIAADQALGDGGGIRPVARAGGDRPGAGDLPGLAAATCHPTRRGNTRLDAERRAGVDQVRVGDVRVRLHQRVHGGPVALGDAGQGVAPVDVVG